ncbi:hypothetical protein CEXT_631121 [Caerostris extrusa]|uniref:Uncharacterized protein n=1 Tax=Caerostris extrusa TaxID=172846 RepID=A0AAV4PMG3_CAEEX|nr:hypothetical protein CEXT_631121 [Caerostris extrusa]
MQKVALLPNIQTLRHKNCPCPPFKLCNTQKLALSNLQMLSYPAFKRCNMQKHDHSLEAPLLTPVTVCLYSSGNRILNQISYSLLFPMDTHDTRFSDASGCKIRGILFVQSTSINNDFTLPHCQASKSGYCLINPASSCSIGRRTWSDFRQFPRNLKKTYLAGSCCGLIKRFLISFLTQIGPFPGIDSFGLIVKAGHEPAENSNGGSSRKKVEVQPESALPKPYY